MTSLTAVKGLNIGAVGDALDARDQGLQQSREARVVRVHGSLTSGREDRSWNMVAFRPAETSFEALCRREKNSKYSSYLEAIH